jgi:hypothetical protein
LEKVRTASSFEWVADWFAKGRVEPGDSGVQRLKGLGGSFHLEGSMGACAIEETSELVELDLGGPVVGELL